MTTLSKDLQPIYQLELESGNEVARIDEPAGTECPYAVIFKHPLHRTRIDAELQLSTSVKYWESRHPYYPMEAGFRSDISGHSVAGPLLHA
jgi:hypothetical protein